MSILTPELEEGSLRDLNSEVMGDGMEISPNIELHDDVGSLARISTTQGLSNTTVNSISQTEGRTLGLKSIDGSLKQNNVEFETLTEGLAHIIVPKWNPSPEPKKGSDLVQKLPQSVFYNPIQQFNRDLSVLAIRAYGEELFDSPRQKTVSKKRKRRNDAPETSEAHRQGTAPADRGGLQDPKAQEAPDGPRGGANEQSHTDERTPVLERNPSGANRAATIPRHGMDPVSVKDLRHVKLRILDALSASGLRALRYAKELPFTTSVVANDLSSTATKSIKQNVAHNGLEKQIEVVTSNALTHMYSLVGNTKNSLKYNVIDLDPYGTAVPFLDAALQSLHHGGLLCVTCTDSGVWASTGYPEKAFSLYGGVSLSGPHCHEAGLRLILNSIAMSAAKYGMAIEPLLSLSIDFYARVFVRVKHSAADVKFLAGKTMVVYNCDKGCGAWSTQMLGRNKESKDRKGGTYYKHSLAQGPSASQLCEHCGRKTHLAGPMYGGRLHSPQFIQRILELLPTLDPNTYRTIPRIRGMLSTALEEFLPESLVTTGSDLPETVSTNGEEATPPVSLNPANPESCPFFFIPHVLSKVIHCQTPPENALRGALKHLGYSTSRSHTKPGSIRTNAPWSVIWEVMREWVRQEAPIKPGVCKEGTAGHEIMKGGLSQLRVEATNGQRIISDDDGPAKSPDQSNENGKGPSKLGVIFDERLGADSQKERLVRYQMNPRANWGPMVRAKAQPPTKS